MKAESTQPEPSSDPAAETVAVKTLRYHTLHGEAHEPGEVYQAPADQVANLHVQGMAVPIEPA